MVQWVHNNQASAFIVLKLDHIHLMLVGLMSGGTDETVLVLMLYNLTSKCIFWV